MTAIKYEIPEDLKHLAHAAGCRTEFEALEKVAPRLNSMKTSIFHELLEATEKGLTPDEYCDRHGLLINTVRRRFTDMWKEGILRHHPDGLTRKNAAGNECVVWVVGYDPHAQVNRRVKAIERALVLQQQIDQVKEWICEGNAKALMDWAGCSRRRRQLEFNF